MLLDDGAPVRLCRSLNPALASDQTAETESKTVILVLGPKGEEGSRRSKSLRSPNLSLASRKGVLRRFRSVWQNQGARAQ
jgi:hypothetical protein